jgi:hypothetical protein
MTVTQSRRLGMPRSCRYRWERGYGGGAGQLTQDRAGSRTLSAPPKRVVDHTFSDSAFAEIGGARVGWWHATYPLAKVTADAEWVRISLAFGIRQVWIGRAETWQIRRSSDRATSGLAFDCTDGLFDSVVWWSMSGGRAIAELAERGWPVQPPSGPLRARPTG